MTCTDFEIYAKSIVCTPISRENELMSCSFKDTHDNVKDIANVSVLFVEPIGNHRISEHYYDVEDSQRRSSVLAHSFDLPMPCRVMGTDRFVNIVCRNYR